MAQLLLPVVRIQLSKTAARFDESCRRRELQSIVPRCGRLIGGPTQETAWWR